MSIPVWQTNCKCKYCETDFIATSETIQFGDLRPPEFFEPDWQYYQDCPKCSSKCIVNNIPSHIAIWIQTQLFVPR